MGWIGITGVSHGLGREMAKIFLTQERKVIGFDLQLEGLELLQSEFPTRFYGHQIDLTDVQSTQLLMEKVLLENGPPDIWINNAGIAVIARFEKTYKSFNKVMQINFQAAVDLTHFWLNPMEEKGEGMIVNIASVAGHVAAPFFTSYSASKFALVGFTQSLQEELKVKSSPIKLTLLSPGFVDTAIMQGQDIQIPEFLRFLRPGPEKCAQEMVDCILKGKDFELPTLNGKILYQMGRIGGPLKRLPMKLISSTFPKDIWKK